MKPNEALEKMNREYRKRQSELSEIHNNIFNLQNDLEENKRGMNVCEYETKKLRLSNLKIQYETLEDFAQGISFAREILMEVDGVFDK